MLVKKKYSHSSLYDHAYFWHMIHDEDAYLRTALTGESDSNSYNVRHAILIKLNCGGEQKII